MTTTPQPGRLSTKATEDYILVRQAIDGNQKAYGTLMDRYKQSVYHTMYKMINNKDDADDLTIEAFGKAFRKLPSYAPNYAFSTWLFKIAVNNCIDHIRKKRIQTMSIDSPIDKNGDKDFTHTIKGYAPTPEDAMMYEQKMSYMRHLINRLNPKYRLMIELRYYEELSYEEIARELQIPLGTVKAQLFRAKELLYNMMQNSQTKAYMEIPAMEAEVA